MNKRQQLFVEEYIIDRNATQAAIRAGYSERTAYSQGQRLLKHVEVQPAIEGLILEVRNKNIASAAEIEEFLSLTMRGEVPEQVLKGVGGGEQEFVEKQTPVKDRVKAAELLAKRHGLLTDKVDISGGLPIIIRDDLT